MTDVAAGNSIHVLARYLGNANVSIEFLGLFDTVPGKLERREANVVSSKSFQDRMLPRKVKTAVHILAMHESRLEFRPILFKAVESAEQRLEQMWMPGSTRISVAAIRRISWAISPCYVGSAETKNNAQV
jgi:Uncharacterized alpha/beta hydrolase domain (DUF2235)